jgi:hypothetical protein
MLQLALLRNYLSSNVLAAGCGLRLLFVAVLLHSDCIYQMLLFVYQMLLFVYPVITGYVL